MKLSLAFKTARIEVQLLQTATAKAVWAALPFDATAQTWGEEVYFTTPVKIALERDAQQIVDPGTVCFWTEGDALALPYGRTPISSDERPKLANRCNVVGKVLGDPRQLAKVRSGEAVRVDKA
jgi:uncharacterized protein